MMIRPALIAGLTATLSLSVATSAGAQSGERRFAVDRFDAVELTGSDDVRITTGSGFSVTASGDPSAVAALRIDVRGGVLRVGRLPGSYHDKGATVSVTLPALRAATVSGSGDLDAGRIASRTFTGRVTGSGDLRLAGLRSETATIEVGGSGGAAIEGLEAQTVGLSLTGSGDIRAAGRAGRVGATLRGSGDIDSRRLATPDLTVDLTGSGDVKATAGERARITAYGSGSVSVTGGARCSVSAPRHADVSCR